MRLRLRSPTSSTFAPVPIPCMHADAGVLGGVSAGEQPPSPLPHLPVRMPAQPRSRARGLAGEGGRRPSPQSRPGEHLSLQLVAPPSMAIWLGLLSSAGPADAGAPALTPVAMMLGAALAMVQGLGCSVRAVWASQCCWAAGEVGERL
eukprot:1139939-Pelagomonas_calceolata.AAC.2